jgi:hypothetical protein
MRRCHLIRSESTDEGTFGTLIIGDEQLFTAEPPWRNNERNVSCIPYGKYECVYSVSMKHGPVYRVQNVPGRTDILIHAGNIAGDKLMGFKSHSDGCIMPGSRKGKILKQKAVVSSGAAMTLLHQWLDKEPFILTVAGILDIGHVVRQPQLTD